MIKTVLFDLDDTLYNERDFVLGGFSDVSRYLSDKYSFDFSEIYNEAVRILNSEGRGKIFNLICEKFKFNEDVNDLVDIYRNAKPKMFPYEDSTFVLKRLYGKYNLGIITDGMASVQRNKINSLGLKKYFDKIIVTDEQGREFWKPHELSFRSMLKSFNCEAEESIYIGDNPNKDFIGARKVGLWTARIKRQMGDYMNLKLSSEYEADYIIESLMAIPSLIAKINNEI